ncbi:MAG: PhzF family phenazine biosynthesis protein [Pseudomonadota bacterium]
MNGTPYWQVEAFADRPGAGNPAGVFLLDSWPGDEWLQSAAAKLKLPATAFLVPSDAVDVDYEICWFSPKSEIALCGHASLASGHVLLERDGGEDVRLQTRRAGIVEVAMAGRASS